MNIDFCCTCGAIWRGGPVDEREFAAIKSQWDATHPPGVKDWYGDRHAPCTAAKSLANRLWFEKEDQRQAKKHAR